MTTLGLARSHATTAKELRRELQRLQDLSDCARELTVIYQPGGSDRLEGEVRGREIRVYNPNSPVDTLRHEFFDYVVSCAVSEYGAMVNVQRRVLNAILADIEERAYGEKEVVVEALVRLVRV